jgi:choice-of-anchor C domain-containing protein
MHRIAATLAMFALAQLASAAPFQNGSFEVGSPVTSPGACFVTLPNGSTNLTGWTVIFGNIDWDGPGCGAQTQTDGSTSLDLVGDQTIGGVQQTFDTVAGRVYQVSFDLNGNWGGLPVVKPLRVTVAGVTQDYTLDTTGEDATNSPTYWATKVFTFTATGASETISLVSNLSGIGTSAGAVIDNVRVIPSGTIPPSLSKSFGAVSMMVGESTSLTFVIDNVNKTTALTRIGFADALPDGLVVATPNGLTGGCDGGTIVATEGSDSVSLAGASLAARSSCTFSVNVTATTPGEKDNTTGPVTSIQADGGTASASIRVSSQPEPPRCIPPAITSGPFPSAAVGVPYVFNVTATGDSPLTFAISGLPAGLAIDPVSGKISGTPAAAGTSTVIVTVTNGCTPNAVQTQSLTVARSESTLAISANPNPAYFGQSVVVIVKASATTSIPQGIVMLCAREATAFCPAPFDDVPPGTPASMVRAPLSATLDATGQATFTLDGLLIDNYIFKASYGGDAANVGASAGPIDEFVIKGVLLAPPKVALAAPSRASSGAPLSIGVQVSPVSPAPVPTGTVRLYSDVNLVASATLDGSGSALLTMVPVANGSLPLRADYSGDGLFPPASSPQSVVTIADAADAPAIPAVGPLGLALLALALAALGIRPLYRRSRRR